MIGLVVVVGVFLLFGALRGDPLATSIDGNVDKYFNIEDPVKVLGVEWTPVAFKRDARPYYFLVLGFIVLTVLGMRRLQNCAGARLAGVREDQLAAEAMGSTAQIRLIAIAWLGLGGRGGRAVRQPLLSSRGSNFLQSVIMFCIVVLGGSGSIPGVLVGTLGMVVLPELLRDVITFLYEGAGRCHPGAAPGRIPVRRARSQGGR